MKIQTTLNNGETRETIDPLTENAFRNTRHCIMPSIVSPVKQNVPVKWRPFRPITEQRLACTKAFCDLVAAVRAGWCDPELISRSNESISLQFSWFCLSYLLRSTWTWSTAARQRARSNLFLLFKLQSAEYLSTIILLLTCNRYTQNYRHTYIPSIQLHTSELICHFLKSSTDQSITLTLSLITSNQYRNIR